jgi:catechol 2,3-dioxygenase-like lactoylglutathione lyase family enzyme
MPVCRSAARTLPHGPDTIAAQRVEERSMQIRFVAGFGPIVRDPAASKRFWGDALGIDMTELGPDYWVNDALDGVKHFGLWPLAQAAEATFGTEAWPEDVPTPSAWMELDVASPDEVVPAIAELQAAGHRVLREAHLEPWGQTTSRLLSPEGILVGITYTPWMHAS